MFLLNVFSEAAVQLGDGLLRGNMIGQSEFQITAGTVVPDVIPRAGSFDHQFRFWSHGCQRVPKLRFAALNDLTEVIQGGQTRTYSYDALGRKTSDTTPEAGTVHYYFTTASGGACAGNTGKVCRRTDARGITTAYSYDAENRLTSKTYSDSTPAAYYYYDESSVTVNGQNYTLANGKGRLTHTSADGGLAITVTDYDPVGRLDDFWQCTPYNCPSGKLWDERYDYYADGGWRRYGARRGGPCLRSAGLQSWGCRAKRTITG